MKKSFVLVLGLLLSVSANANGICGADKQVFECLISSGSLQQADLCKDTTGKIYLSELNNVGSIKHINLSAAQLNKWNAQKIIQWNCGKKEKELGICSTIDATGKNATYTINEIGTSNEGYCD